MSHRTLHYRWAKPEIVLCVVGILLFVVLKFLILDGPARHQRVWQEAQLLGELCQRQGLYAECESLMSIALRESDNFGSGNSRTVISLSDRGFLNFRQGKFEDAISDFNIAAEQIAHSADAAKTAEPALLSAEFLRIDLQRARSFQALGRFDDARSAYLQTIQQYLSSDRSTADRANDFRFKQAFVAYCALSEDATDIRVFDDLLAVFARTASTVELAPEQKLEMFAALKTAVLSSEGIAISKTRVLEKITLMLGVRN